MFPLFFFHLNIILPCKSGQLSKYNILESQVYHNGREQHADTVALAHHPPTAVVVKIHQGTGVFHHPLLGIYKGLCEFNAEVDVVAASAPVEGASVVARLPSLVAVTVADLQLPLAAGPGNGVDHSSGRDGVHKRCLSTAWVAQGKEVLQRTPLGNDLLLLDNGFYCHFYLTKDRVVNLVG